MPRCPERCSGHGHCLASDLAAACVCDEGYVGYDCAALQPPPPPAVPPGSIAPPAPPVLVTSSLHYAMPAPPLALQLDVTARSSALSSAHGMPLSPILPPGASSLYWALDGTPPRALRIDASGSLVVHTDAALESTSAFLPRTATQVRRAALAVLQAEPSADDPSRRVVASVVDWLGGHAYVALRPATPPSTEDGVNGPAHVCTILKLALPSLSSVKSVAPTARLGKPMWPHRLLLPQPNAHNMTSISAMALAGHASDAAAPAAWLHVLRATDTGTVAELLVYTVGDLEPWASMTFDVPSPVVSAHYDARSGWLYMLCAHPLAKLLRVQMYDGKPAAPPGLGDTLPLPHWDAALPLLVPFSKSRQLVFFSAPAASKAGAATPLHVCRVRTDAPPPLSESGGASDGSCIQLRGTYALEEVLSAVADEESGSAYLGCRSGRALRLTIAPFRVEEALQLGGAPLVASAFRPHDGTLWLASSDGELTQLATRAVNGSSESSSLWSRFPSLTAALGGRLHPDLAAMSARAAARSPPAPLPPSRRPPPSPPPLTASVGAEDATVHAFFWVYRKLGYGPAIVLALLGACLGSMLGGRLYRLVRLITITAPTGGKEPPGGLLSSM